MAQVHSSATEHALENQRLGALQIRVAVICGLIQMCDGYDVGTIGWSVPSLTHAWQVAPSSFALVRKSTQATSHAAIAVSKRSG